MDTKRQDVEEKRDKLNNKIKNLYGPITGNRILHESAIRAIEKHHSMPVKDVLKDICRRKDAEELENWRGFYSKVKKDMKVLHSKLFSSQVPQGRFFR